MTAWSRVAPGLALVAAVALGCAPVSGRSGPPPSPPAGGAVIVASGIAFDRATLEVPTGRTFPLLFENRDFAPHDVAIYPENGDDAVFVGETFSGPDSRIYQVPSLPPGTYRFECQVHPQMDGTLIAKPPA
jgi:plastocyanin